MSVERMSDGRGWSCVLHAAPDGSPMGGEFLYLWGPQPELPGWRACREVWTGGHIAGSWFEWGGEPDAVMTAAKFPAPAREAFNLELVR